MKKAKLGDVCRVQGGYAFKSNEFQKNKIPVIRIGNIQENNILLDDNICYTEDFLNNHPEFEINKGDILIAMSGATVGKVGKYLHESRALLNQRVGKFIITGNLEKRYLYFLLQAPLFKKFILNNAFGCAQPNISNGKIEEFEFCIYEIEKQIKIATQLDKIQEIINQKNEQLENFEQLVKSQFVEMFENNKKVENKKIVDICSSIVRGPFGSALKKEFFVEKSENTYKVYEQKNAINGDWKLGTYYIDEEKFNELKRFECKAKDIIMSCSGTIGRFYQFPDNIDKGVINQALLKFTINEDIVLSQYFIDYMKMNLDVLDTKGSGLQNIGSVSFIKEMEIPVPKIELQTKYLNFVKLIDKQKFEIQKSLEEMQKLQESLMNKYFG